MKLRDLFEDHSKNFPKKITLQDARHSLEYREDNFKKRGLGPLLKIVPDVISALPPRSMIEVTWGGDSTEFFYHSGEAWFDAAGKKTDPVKIAKYLKELNDADEPHEFRAMGWVLKDTK
jgi:hypothetical protein